MKKGTKVGLTLLGIAGLAAAAAVAVKKYKENFCEDDLLDEDAEFLEEFDELEEDFADDGRDEVNIEKEEKIVKPAVKIPAKKKVVKKTTKTVKAKTAKKSS